MNTLGYESNNTSFISECHALRQTCERTYKRIQGDVFLLQAERRALRSERNRLNDRIEKMRNTLSWRMTAPLRDSRLAKIISQRLRTERK